jgi:hypothetical protein
MKEHAMRTILFLSVLLLIPAAARAEEPAAIVVDATQILPKEGVHAGATGVGAELRFVPDDECMTMSIGGFAAAGDTGDRFRRDVLDVHFQIGVKTKKKSLAPYLGLGVDVLHVTTHVEETQMSFRGTTLGLSAQAGLVGTLGEHIVVRATAGYMGAIVPGTGDDLSAVVLQVGVGYQMDD